MIILDMNAKSTPILVPDSAFSVETGVLTLQLSLGQYPLVGKTLTAVFWPTKVETGPLAVANGIVQLPITLGLVAAGPNEIQLNIREGLTLEQSPKMLWFISTSVLATDPAPTEVDIITALIAQANAATADAEAVVESFEDVLGEGHLLEESLEEDILAATAIEEQLRLTTTPAAVAINESLTDPVTGSIVQAEAAEGDLQTLTDYYRNRESIVDPISYEQYRWTLQISNGVPFLHFTNVAYDPTFVLDTTIVDITTGVEYKWAFAINDGEISLFLEEVI